MEMPWWTYGARGMQLWFPSSLAEPLSPTTRETMGFSASTDPELEFDREVYPVGISLAEVAVVGAPRLPLPLPPHASRSARSSLLSALRSALPGVPSAVRSRAPLLAAPWCTRNTFSFPQVSADVTHMPRTQL